MQDWRDDVVKTVLRLIRKANRGDLPETLLDWREVCEYYSRDLILSKKRSRRKACLFDDVLVVQEGETERQTCCRIAHEIAEYLLQSEFAPPYCYPFTGRTIEQERHTIACAVERSIPGCCDHPEARLNPSPRRQAPRPAYNAEWVAIESLKAQMNDLDRKLHLILQHLGIPT